MTKYAYLFEAKSIQSYIFSTNKLKEIVGGSELIEQLTSDGGLVDATLDSLSLKKGKDIRLSRCAGAAFYVFSDSEESLNKLSTLWPLVFRQYAPDMEFIHARGKGESDKQAFEVAHTALLANRNLPKVRLPQANVYTQRFARTGEPVSQLNKYKEPLDQVTARKLQFVKHDGLIQRVAGKDSSSDQWPVNLTPEKDSDDKNFPFKGGSSLIGLIHADGNGLGQLLMDLKGCADKGLLSEEHYTEAFKQVSEAIQTATEEAAQASVKAVLQSVKDDDKDGRGLYPARPIVLGGDDLTMIVRADLALPFTQTFLKTFEVTSEKALKKVKKHPSCKKLGQVIPDKLTACAGIVYAKSSQPFSLLHDLAEDLCKKAKSVSKKTIEGAEGRQLVPSSISFYRVTTSLVDSFDVILERELVFDKTQLTRVCYAVHEHSEIASLDKLLVLQKALSEKDGLRGALRQIVGLLQQLPNQAQSRYSRLREVLESRKTQEGTTEWDVYHAQLKALSSQEGAEFEDFDIEHPQALPFEDVLSLLAVNNDLSALATGEEKA